MYAFPQEYHNRVKVKIMLEEASIKILIFLFKNTSNILGTIVASKKGTWNSVDEWHGWYWPSQIHQWKLQRGWSSSENISDIFTKYIGKIFSRMICLQDVGTSPSTNGSPKKSRKYTTVFRFVLDLFVFCYHCIFPFMNNQIIKKKAPNFWESVFQNLSSLVCIGY